MQVVDLNMVFCFFVTWLVCFVISLISKLSLAVANILQQRQKASNAKHATGTFLTSFLDFSPSKT
jgi:hypothetical protein